jgi:hypothetical protein
MMGHNSKINAQVTVNTAIGAVAEAFSKVGDTHSTSRDAMIIAGRTLLAVEVASANNPEYAEAELRSAGLTKNLPSGHPLTKDRVRKAARWLARGGIEGRNLAPQQIQWVSGDEILFSKINDLDSANSNSLETAFRQLPRFAKAFHQLAAYDIVRRDCGKEIRNALLGKEGAPTLDSIRETYSDVLFEADTVEAWVKDQQYKLTAEYQEELLRQAALRDVGATEDPSVKEAINVFLDPFIKARRGLAEQKQAEATAKANAPKLTPMQRHNVEQSFRKAAQKPDQPGVSDEDF